MNRLTTRLTVGILTVGLGLAGMLAARPAAAADEATVLRLRGERAAAAGRCEEALELLARARQADPGDARAALVAGQCQIRLRRYPEAVASLERARELDPSLVGVDLHLGIARFHQEDLEGAERALERARERDPERAEVHLYLGLLELQRAESAEAIGSFGRARRADAERVEPIASYYEGLAQEVEGRYAEAEASLRRAQELGAGTVWEQEARAALERLEQREDRPWKSASPRALERLTERSTRWWVDATAGVEYDDNVVLRGSGVQLPQEIASQNDVRAVWWVEAGYEVVSTPEWTVGLLASYYGNAHQDLEDFNLQFPGVSLWVDHRPRPETTARIQYDFAYAWVGGSEPFLVQHTWTPALYQEWGSPGTTRLFARFQKQNFMFDNQDVPDGVGDPGDFCPSVSIIVCGPSGLDEESARNRDGWGYQVGFDHLWPVGFLGENVVLRGGYRFYDYSARGREYSFHGHELQAGFRAFLPLGFAFEAYGSYAWLDYRNPSTFPDPEDVFAFRQYPLSGTDRSDGVARIDLVLERPVTDYLTLSLRYAWFDNASNVDVFDYNREILGLYATLRFRP